MSFVRAGLLLDPSPHTADVDYDGTARQQTAQGQVAPSAHTVAVDPTTYQIYHLLEDVAGKPILRVMVLA